jgi:DhnA family fructose-bisphosphate aldolase class Ia
MTPLDHAPWLGPIDGINRPRQIVKKVVAGGANALLVTPGFLREAAPEVSTQTGIILRVSAICATSSEAVQETPFATVETALQMNADAVAASIFFGRGGEVKMMEWMGQLVESCSRYDMPVLLEMMPPEDKFTDPGAIAHVARLGMEIGADIVKTNYCGDPKVFRDVVASVCVPVIVAGGANNNGNDKIAGVVSMINEILEAGASGVAVGRKVWQDDDAENLVRAMKRAMFA